METYKSQPEEAVVVDFPPDSIQMTNYQSLPIEKGKNAVLLLFASNAPYI